MWRMTRNMNYGILVMEFLCKYDTKPVSAKGIAEKIHLSPSLVAKTLKILARNSFVESIQGPKGGYRVKVDPQSVSLLSIVKALEGEIALTPCTEPGDTPKCDRADFCAIRPKMKELNQRMLDMLNDVSLAEIIQKPEMLSALNYR